MRHRRFGLATLPALAIVLVGCAAVAPVAVPSTTPVATSTPTAEPRPEPATAVIGARGITVLDEDGAQLAAVSFADPGQTAVDLLTTVFDSAPVVSHRESDFNCVPAADRAVWDGFFVLTYNIDGWTPGGQVTVAQALAPESSNGVALRTASGIGVGDTVDAIAAAQPGVHVETATWEGTTYAWVHYEIGEGAFVPHDDPDWGMESYWGATAMGVDGTITGLHAPVEYIDQC